MLGLTRGARNPGDGEVAPGAARRAEQAARRPAGRRAAVAFGLLALLALAACRAPAEPAADVGVEHELSPEPPSVGPAVLAVTLTGPDGAPVTGAEVSVEGNMSHPGMKPVLATAAEVRPGRYEAKMEFTMAGDWFIIVDAALPDGRAVRKQVDVHGVKS
jgi:hypothetical protein